MRIRSDKKTTPRLIPKGCFDVCRSCQARVEGLIFMSVLVTCTGLTAEIFLILLVFFIGTHSSHLRISKAEPQDSLYSSVLLESVIGSYSALRSRYSRYQSPNERPLYQHGAVVMRREPLAMISTTMLFSLLPSSIRLNAKVILLRLIPRSDLL
jgi:hypothetical protein